MHHGWPDGQSFYSCGLAKCLVFPLRKMMWDGSLVFIFLHVYSLCDSFVISPNWPTPCLGGLISYSYRSNVWNQTSIPVHCIKAAARFSWTNCQTLGCQHWRWRHELSGNCQCCCNLLSNFTFQSSSHLLKSGSCWLWTSMFADVGCQQIDTLIYRFSFTIYIYLLYIPQQYRKSISET